MKRLGLIFTSLAFFSLLSLNVYKGEEVKQLDIYSSTNVSLVNGSIKNTLNEPLVAQIRLLDDEGQMIARNQTNLEGAFELSVPKGSYIIEFSKGYEYDDATVKVNVNDDLPINLGTIILEKKYDWSTLSYYGGDVHQHSNYSDGLQKVVDIFISNISNGLSFGMLSDHNSTEGIGEWMLTSSYKLGNHQLFIPIGGVEVTTKNGHFQAMDVQQIYDVKNLDSDEEMKTLLQEMKLSSALTQINHPMRTDHLGFNQWQFAELFNTIEIWNGHAMPPIDGINDVLDEFLYNTNSKHKWFELLNSGIRIAATSGSDNHDITGNSQVKIESENIVFNEWYNAGLFTGNPRTYVKVEELSKDNILNALGKGASFLTNGPLLDVSINENTFGDTIPFNEIAKIKIRAVSNKENLKAINIIADGLIIKTLEVPNNNVNELIELNVSSYDYLVFEVLTNDYGYAISNPIYIK